MKQVSYDIIIVGGGSAGLTAAETAITFGKRVALVAERLGGDCLWSGCVPSKALLSVAKVNQYQKLPLSESWPLVRARIEHARNTIRAEHDNASFYEDLGIDVYEERARFVGDRTLAVGDTELIGKKILLATGSRPRIPNIPGLAEVSYITNEELFELETVPASLTIIGGGPIGCELGQGLQQLGCQVTIIQSGERLMQNDEPEAAAIILDSLRSLGVKVVLNAKVLRVGSSSNGIIVTYGTAGEELTIENAGLLLAVGRIPNTESLQLERTNVTHTERGIPHNTHLQTNHPHIYVAGDVAGDYQFTHFASAQAGAAVQNMLFPIFKAKVPTIVPWCTFTSPEVAHTGLTVAAAEKQGVTFEVIDFPLTNIDRALAEDKTNGFIKILIGPGEKIIGATIVAEPAGDMIQVLTLAITKRLSVEQVLRMITAYPTYSSGIQQALFYRFLSSDAFIVRLGKRVAKFL